MPNVLTTQPNIGRALCESAIIPFLVQCHKLSLTSTAWVPCRNAEIYRRMQELDAKKVNLACGKIPLWGKSPGRCIYSVPVHDMAKHRAVWLTSVERHCCSNEAKTRNPLKLAGVPQTRQQISAVSGLKFTISRVPCTKVLSQSTSGFGLFTPFNRSQRARQACDVSFSNFATQEKL